MFLNKSHVRRHLRLHGKILKLPGYGCAGLGFGVRGAHSLKAERPHPAFSGEAPPEVPEHRSRVVVALRVNPKP